MSDATSPAPPAFAPFFDAAASALQQGRRDDAKTALAQALPLLKDDVVAGETFLGVVSEQAALMSLAAGDLELAQKFAWLTLWDTARSLRDRGAEHRRLVTATEASGAPGYQALEQARALLAEMYTYAVAFVPMVQGQTMHAPLAAFAETSANIAAGIDVILKNVRPQLDRAGWASWPYEEQTARLAMHWSAYAFVQLGNSWLENTSSGRDIEDTERLVDGGLALIPAGESDRLTADALALKARVLFAYDVGNLKQAIALAERSCAILDALPDPTGAAAERSNIAAYYQTQAASLEADDPAGAAALRGHAEQLLREALDTLRAADPYGHMPNALANLGVLLTATNPDEAYRTLLEADATAPQTRETFELRARIAVNLGALLNDERRYAEALPWFEKALAALPADGSLTADPAVDVMARGGSGVALLKTAGAASAEARLSEAVDIIEAYRRSFYSERANMVLLQHYRWVHEAYIDCCATLGEQDATYRKRAFEIAERLKWRMLTTLLRFKPLGMVDEGQEPLAKRERELLHALSARLLGDPSAVKRDAGVVEAMAELDRIWTALAPKYPEYVALRREETATCEAVVAALDDEISVLVEYYLGDQYDTALAFVIVRPDPIPHIVRLPQSPKQIEGLVEVLRTKKTRLPAQGYRDTAAALHHAIVEPLLPLIPEGAGACVVPYGQLHNAPFAGLWDGRRYLIERNSLVLAGSASALRWWIGKDRSRLGRCLLFTATAGITEGSERMADLAGFSELAVKALRPLFPDSTLIAGADATKPALLQALTPADAPAPDVVHIACHGIAKKPGLASCLLLAGQGTTEDKDLSALEIAVVLQLEATLVTLSACSSAVAETTSGDDVAGLAQSFLIGGASAVLATLWEVRQDAGVAITRAFYQRLRAEPHCSKVAALRSALIGALRPPNALQRLGGLLGVRDDLSHPYLWSAFQLYGNWR